MAYFVPPSLDDALALIARGDAGLLAGGTDFFPALGDRAAPLNIVDISQVPELLDITETAEGWHIGSSVTWSKITKTPLPPCFDALKLAAREVGSWQIQNAGTIAGNLCNASPAADGVPPLLVLDAQVVLSSQSGMRTLPLADFLTGPRKTALKEGEIVTAIRVPRLSDDAQSHFVKIGARKYMIISIAMVAAIVICDELGRITQARIAVGSCSATATRLPGLEVALIGATTKELAQDRALWTRYLDPIAPIDDLRATADYRHEAASELCKRAVCTALEKGLGDG